MAIYGQASGCTVMTDWEKVEEPAGDEPGKVVKAREYEMTQGAAYLYNEGDLHSLCRLGKYGALDWAAERKAINAASVRLSAREYAEHSQQDLAKARCISSKSGDATLSNFEYQDVPVDRNLLVLFIMVIIDRVCFSTLFPVSIQPHL